MGKDELRPVRVKLFGKTMKGYFHRFVYQMANYHSDTKVLIELEDGRLRYFDPYFVQFTDRTNRYTNKKELTKGRADDDTTHDK